MAERAALRFQLEAEASRRRSAEKALALHAPPAGVRLDVPGGGRRRGAASDGGTFRPLSALVEAHGERSGAPPPAAAAHLAAAADGVLGFLDSLGARVGRVLRGAPVARAGCVAYALAVHAWLFLAPFVQLFAMPTARAHAHS
eukprot:scaffold12772_cov126-Isochrysis_galbana.AAC.1